MRNLQQLWRSSTSPSPPSSSSSPVAMSVSSTSSSPPEPRFSLTDLSDTLLQLCLQSLGLRPDVFQECNLDAWRSRIEVYVQLSDTHHLVSSFLSDIPNVRSNFSSYYKLCVNPRGSLPSLALHHPADEHVLRKAFISERLVSFFEKMIALLEDLCESEALGIASACGDYVKEKFITGSIKSEASGFKHRDCRTVAPRFASFRKTRKSLTKNSGGDGGRAFGCLDLFCLTLGTLMSVSEMDIAKAHISRRQCKVLQLAYGRINGFLVQLFHLFSILEAWHPFLSTISLFDGLGKELCRLLLDGHTFLEDCICHTWSSWPVTKVFSHWELLYFLEKMDCHCKEVTSKIQTIVDKSPRSRFKVPPLELLDLQVTLTQASERDYLTLHSELQIICTKFDQNGCTSQSEQSEQTSPSNDTSQTKEVLKAKWLSNSLVCHTKLELGNSGYLFIEPEHVKRGQFWGQGSSAKVYEADCWGEKYAMKQLGADIDNFSSRDEIFVHFKLRHPNIVRVIGYTSGVDGNSKQAFLMEPMTDSLRNVLDSQRPHSGGSSPYPQEVSVDILLQIANAMEYLHRQNITHRDLKASNVLVDGGKSCDYWGEGYIHVKVADFGLAREVTRRDMTAPVGTLPWMAPEITSNLKHSKGALDSLFNIYQDSSVSVYGLPADVYSFGITGYEIVSGAMPYEGESTSSATFRRRIVSGLRPTLPKNMHPDLSNLIKACWEGRPELRPSFTEICCKLRKIKFEMVHPRFNEAFDARPSG